MSSKMSMETSLPSSWIEIARRLNVPATYVSQAARVVLMSEEQEVPKHLPNPSFYGSDFVKKIERILISRKRTKRSGSQAQPGENLSRRMELERTVRKALDDNSDLLGDNLIETVADQLSISIDFVATVFRRRFEALRLERKILAEMEEAETADRIAKAKRERALRQAAAEGEEMERQRYAPSSETRSNRIPATPTRSETKTPHTSEEMPQDSIPSRTEKLPPVRSNVELEETLRAAWIARAAGISDAIARTLASLQSDFPSLTLEDVSQAIEHAYLSRPEGARKQMERRAERMKQEIRK